MGYPPTTKKGPISCLVTVLEMNTRNYFRYIIFKRSQCYKSEPVNLPILSTQYLRISEILWGWAPHPITPKVGAPDWPYLLFTSFQHLRRWLHWCLQFSWKEMANWWPSKCQTPLLGFKTRITQRQRIVLIFKAFNCKVTAPDSPTQQNFTREAIKENEVKMIKNVFLQKISGKDN